MRCSSPPPPDRPPHNGPPRLRPRRCRIDWPEKMTTATTMQPAVGPCGAGSAAEHAYPLRRWFLRLILPGLIAWGMATVAATSLGTGAAIEEVYLDVAERQIAALEDAIANVMPGEWHAFLSAPSAAEFLGTEAGLRLQHVVLTETAEWKAGAATFFAPDGRVLFARETALIDTHPRDADVRKVARTGEALLLAPASSSGGTAYHLFVPVGARSNQPDLVIEVERPARAVSGIV